MATAGLSPLLQQIVNLEAALNTWLSNKRGILERIHSKQLKVLAQASEVKTQSIGAVPPGVLGTISATISLARLARLHPSNLHKSPNPNKTSADSALVQNTVYMLEMSDLFSSCLTELLLTPFVSPVTIIREEVNFPKRKVGDDNANKGVHQTKQALKPPAITPLISPSFPH
ncbi:unnamed protein product [Leptosia nina]|uniref:Uncharacterized protein n=1 Tax=Leptosia nina TaxID=320188 RepID=A0AAV1JTR4_9NEOP